MTGMVLVVALFLAVNPVQDPPRRLRAAPGGEPGGEAFKVVEAYVLSNLQEGLGLSDDQFVKLLPLVKRMQTDRRDFAQRRMRILLEMRKQFGSGTATEARVVDLLKELKALETDEPGVLRKDMDAIDAALSPIQQAKYRVFEVEVERRIREAMRQMGGPRPEPRGRRQDQPHLPPQQLPE